VTAEPVIRPARDGDPMTTVIHDAAGLRDPLLAELEEMLR
jgi:hypothetical protein